MKTENNLIDFLAVGDLVIDHFIKLKDASVHCDINHESCTISMRWGDKIPYEKVDVVHAVGNGPNASVSAARLGLVAGLMSHLGPDKDGDSCIESLEKDNVDTRFITRENGKHTNNHYVLSYEAERTILIKHETFTYDLKNQIDGKPTPEWLYFSSVGEDSIQYHEDIAKWVKENNIKLAFQPGTFQIKLGYEKIKYIYEASEIFFCNKEEARRLLEPIGKIKVGALDGGNDDDMKILLPLMRELGPKIVCISDGPNGAYSFDGVDMWYIPMYPDSKSPIDRTGAGDAFSSTFTVALALGKSIPEALSWGPINSMSVVQYVGAQEGLLGRDEIEEYLKNAPESYRPRRLE